MWLSTIRLVEMNWLGRLRYRGRVFGFFEDVTEFLTEGMMSGA